MRMVRLGRQGIDGKRRTIFMLMQVHRFSDVEHSEVRAGEEAADHAGGVAPRWRHARQSLRPPFFVRSRCCCFRA